jgi:hypothetical protein
VVAPGIAEGTCFTIAGFTVIIKRRNDGRVRLIPILDSESPPPDRYRRILRMIADVSSPPVMVCSDKLLKLLATDQTGIQEADGSIPFSSTRFWFCARGGLSGPRFLAITRLRERFRPSGALLPSGTGHGHARPRASR